MSANPIPIGYSIYLRTIAGGLRTEVEALDKRIAHRDLWLEKVSLDRSDNVSDDHVMDAYTRTIDRQVDRVMAKACAAKEALRMLRGEGL